MKKRYAVGNGFVAEMTVLTDPAPSRAEQQFVGQSRKLIGIGLFDAPQIFITNGGTTLEFHGLRQHEHDIPRECQTFVMLRLTANPGFGKVTAFGETTRQRLSQKWYCRIRSLGRFQ